MPKIVEQPKKKIKRVEAQPVERPILYPEVKIAIYCEGSQLGKLDVATAKKLLGWETEEEYCERTGDAPGSKTFGDPLLTDEDGKKIQCWHNLGNRPFGESWCRQLAQDILTGNWRFNLETIIVSKTGKVTSGQHRLVGLVLADQLWKTAQEKYEETCPQEPAIECLIAFGGSEEAEVLRTIDNVKPRTLADVFYTSGIFKPNQPSTERKELARMLDFAVDLLWKRTGADETSGTKFQTHSASVDFLDRHPKLLKCVLHLFGENKERAISALKLSPGKCSTLMYLMAAYKTDGDVYRNSQPPSEKKIDFETWAKAEELWTSISGRSKSTGDLREAIAHCERDILKQAVLAKAWPLCMSGKKITSDDLQLELKEDENGVEKLAENPDFLGIDAGYMVEAEDEDPPIEEDEVEKLKTKLAETKGARVEEMKTKIIENREQTKEIKKNSSIFEELTKENPGRTLLFRSKNGGYVVWGEHADSLVRVLRLQTVTKSEGMTRAVIPEQKKEEAISELQKAGCKVSIAEEVISGQNKEKKISVTHLDSPTKNGKK